MEALTLASSSNNLARSFMSASVYCVGELCLVKILCPAGSPPPALAGVLGVLADSPAYAYRARGGTDDDGGEMGLWFRRRASKERSSSS